MEIKQPVGCPRCYAFVTVVRGGKKGTGKPRQVEIKVPGRLIAPVARYAAGMTTGGYYHDYELTNPAGTPISVTGFFDDGTVIVHMPIGGVSRLSKADIEILEWPESIEARERSLYESLTPHIHQMVSGKTRHRIDSEAISERDFCCVFQHCGMWEHRQ